MVLASANRRQHDRDYTAPPRLSKKPGLSPWPERLCVSSVKTGVKLANGLVDRFQLVELAGNVQFVELVILFDRLVHLAQVGHLVDYVPDLLAEHSAREARGCRPGSCARPCI